MDSDPVSLSLRRDVPKTSEYAYFKKVKNKVVHGPACSLSCSVGEVSGGRERQSDHNPWLPPRSWKDDEPLEIKEPTKRIRKRSSLLTENVTPAQQRASSSLPNKLSVNSEIQGAEIGSFSVKRKKLCQLACTSFSDIAKLQLKGFDLVSSLCSRLFPVDYENTIVSNKDRSDKSIVIYDTKNMGCDDEIDRFHSRWSDKIVSLEWGQHLGSFLGNSNGDLPFTNQTLFGSFYVEEGGEFPYANEQSREEYSKLMLGWKDEKHITYSPEIDPNPEYSCLALATVAPKHDLKIIDYGDDLIASSSPAERCLDVGLFSHDLRSVSDCRNQDWREDKIWDGMFHQCLPRHKWCFCCGELSSYEGEFGCENCFFFEAARNDFSPLSLNYHHWKLL